ncbi:hypothetical protein JYU15_00140 [bacterium AH-315-I18]|nr:hypothetical protein [bacterium AH-315-I18]
MLCSFDGIELQVKQTGSILQTSIGRVNLADLTLIPQSERTVLPLEGTPDDPTQVVPRMGHFHATILSPTQAIVTAGQTCPVDTWDGHCLGGRIQWGQE